VHVYICLPPVNLCIRKMPVQLRMDKKTYLYCWIVLLYSTAFARWQHYLLLLSSY